MQRPRAYWCLPRIRPARQMTLMMTYLALIAVAYGRIVSAARGAMLSWSMLTWRWKKVKQCLHLQQTAHYHYRLQR
ncbi:hypothetical protein PInf_020275 [Phytophthora infestans]|nr:hypothetical protein PInf_020275 [Phytophthora infestans]